MLEVTNGLTIGRAPEAGFPVDDEGVSRIHIRLNVSGGGSVSVTDMGSRNGMYVNGLHVEVSDLHDGDKILIGTTTILKCSYADKIDEAYQQQMYNSALRDSLTGLYSRRYFLDQLEAELSYARRHQ
ncbi:MAG: FHA domain-containing protein, partial [Acidobacteriota bacterium]